MRIGRKDFDRGHRGIVYQAVWQVVPEDEAVDEGELRAAYDRVTDPDKPSFEDVLKTLGSELESKTIDGGTYYIHRKRWLSTSDVARRLGVSKRTVQAWAQQGKLIGQRVGHGITSHRRIRFAADTVDDWLHSNFGAKGDPSGTRGSVPSATAQAVATSAVTEVWDNPEDAAYDRV